MATKEDYEALNARIRKLEQTRAVLQAQEQIKQEKRNQLLQELKAAGVNTDDLEGEALRLQKEIDQDFESATKAVEDFERKLNEAEKQGAIQ